MKPGKIFLLLALASALATACAPFSAPKPPTAQPPAMPTLAQSPAPLPPLVNNTASPIASPVEPTPVATEEAPPVKEPLSVETAALVTKAKEILIQKAPQVNAAGITLSAAEARQWRDSSLGCPREGMMYNQVITPGYLIILEAEGKTYEFHTSKSQNVILCLIDGQKPN